MVEWSISIGLGKFNLYLLVSSLDGIEWGFFGLIVPSTILSGRSQSATLKNPTFKVWERRDSNPGLLGEKRKRYLCAMLPPGDRVVNYL